MKISAIIIDDEKRGIVALKQLITIHCPDLIVIGEARNIDEAYTLIITEQPEVIFLDIEMPKENGFQLLERFDNISFEVVFVTAYQEFALKAIKFSALDYLLKPVKAIELKATFERIKDKQVKKIEDQFKLLNNTILKGKPLSRIILSNSDGFHPVKIDDIIYCRGDNTYTHFYLQNGKHYLVSKNIGEYCNLLDTDSFVRIHKSYLVNLTHVEKIQKSDGTFVIMSNGDELPVSIRRKDELLSKIKHL